jgi:hypothetical protein
MWNSKIRQVQSPELYSYVIRNNISVAEASRQNHLYDILHTPISEEAYQQYMSLSQDLGDLPQTQENMVLHLGGKNLFSQKGLQGSVRNFFNSSNS